MYPKTVSDIRKSFLEYFKTKGHTVVPSSSLIPVGDPTLLFTTAGMVQFKPLFTGAVPLPYTRATSSQKSLRTTDLENVGKTERHCTFFEMLGNFSFGDYFKKESIEYALDFSINYLGFNKNDIWITVYLDDDEAESMWIAAGIPKERIVRLGKEDNFWGPAGETGACGPCSELYLDRGVSKGKPGCGTKDSCKPGCDCDRFLEYWNLVFNQFDKDKEGKYNPLKQTGIDTGSGLERLALLIQKVDSVYDTDELRRIISYIEKLTGIQYNKSNAASFRVLTDHSRAITFAVADGIYPDKTGRGYVIRRLIRRASLFARKINIKEAFLYKLIPEVVSIYQEAYPYLKDKQKSIETILHSEETLFLNTLESGLVQLELMLANYSTIDRVFKGTDSFKLYGTFGFPKEMTKEILLERGFIFDEKSFEEELEKDRNISRQTWKGQQSTHSTVFSGVPATEFVGYTRLETESEILLLSQNDAVVSSISNDSVSIVVTKQTPFYAEAGGQLGDVGFIKTKDSIFQVIDTQKENDIYLHIGRLINGKIDTGASATLSVDASRRNLLTYHHSGTHLLNGALRNILGNHVMQKASLVSDEYLRFDFSHPAALEEQQIEEVENKVNFAISRSVAVTTKVLPIEEAKKTGAVAAFDEKYGNIVRIVEMSEFSTEFCGGCHVKNTGDIQYFMIKKESSPGAGNRRIEAVCGSSVIEYFQEEFQKLTSIVQNHNLVVKDTVGEKKELMVLTQLPEPQDINRIFQDKGSAAVKHCKSLRKETLELLDAKQAELQKVKKQVEDRAVQGFLASSGEIYKGAKKIGALTYIAHTFSSAKTDHLKQLADKLKDNKEPVLVLFCNQTPDSVVLLYMCNKPALSLGVKCNELLKEVAPILGGKGGGKADIAQGGGKDSSKIEDALALSEKLVSKLV
jgi:alanyl-tRNA synthetase